MKVEITKIADAFRGMGWQVVNAVCLVVGLLLLAALEGWSAWYAVASAPAGDPWPTPWGAVPRAALLHGVVGAGFGLGAFVAMFVATGLARDERPQVRASALGARIVALGMLTVPVGNLAGAINMDHRLASFAAYTASAAYAADQEVLADKMADSRLKAEIALRVVPPTQAEFDPLAYVQAVFFHLMVALFACVRMAPPITQAEREQMEKSRIAAMEERKRQERNLKARQSRQRKAALKAKAEKKAEAKPIFGLVSGGKS